MKKLLISLSLYFILSITLLAQSYSGDSWASVKAKGSGTLACVYYPTPGLVYEEAGQVKGVCADILEDFTSYVKNKYGKTINIKYVGKETVWTTFLNKTLKGSNTLGVANVTITKERKNAMKFTPSYIQNPLIFLTNSAAPSILSAEQIKTKYAGYTPIVINGSTHVKVLKNLQKQYFPNLEIKYLASGKEVLKMLEENPKTFTVLDFTEYYDALKKRKPIKHQKINIDAPEEELAFIMPLGSDWQPLWNEFLTPAYKKSTTYRKIIAANLGNGFWSMLK